MTSSEIVVAFSLILSEIKSDFFMLVNLMKAQTTKNANRPYKNALRIQEQNLEQKMSPTLYHPPTFPYNLSRNSFSVSMENDVIL